LLAEFEARRQEFGSFREFVDAKAKEIPWVDQIWRRLTGE